MSPAHWDKAKSRGDSSSCRVVRSGSGDLPGSGGIRPGHWRASRSQSCRLDQSAKSLGIEILDRLRRVESDLTLIAETLLADATGLRDRITARLQARFAERFTSLALISPDGSPAPPWLTSVDIEPTPVEAASYPCREVGAARADGLSRASVGHDARVGMGGLRFSSARGQPAFVWNPDSVPPQTEIHVLGRRWLRCAETTTRRWRSERRPAEDRGDRER